MLLIALHLQLLQSFQVIIEIWPVLVCVRGNTVEDIYLHWVNQFFIIILVGSLLEDSDRLHGLSVTTPGCFITVVYINFFLALTDSFFFKYIRSFTSFGQLFKYGHFNQVFWETFPVEQILLKMNRFQEDGKLYDVV